eukprot:1198951-Pleurochrysis_carterae.AAC.2
MAAMPGPPILWSTSTKTKKAASASGTREPENAPATPKQPLKKQKVQSEAINLQAGFLSWGAVIAEHESAKDGSNGARTAPTALAAPLTAWAWRTLLLTAAMAEVVVITRWSSTRPAPRTLTERCATSPYFTVN